MVSEFCLSDKQQSDLPKEACSEEIDVTRDDTFTAIRYGKVCEELGILVTGAYSAISNCALYRTQQINVEIDDWTVVPKHPVKTGPS